MTEGNREKADEIEQDIVKTQNKMSDTVDKLKGRLTPQSLLNSVLGDDKQGFDQIVKLAKRNPFAVALIGVGAAWLATGKEAKLPAMGESKPGAAGSDPHHRSYVDHMARIEMRDSETPYLYQQRRDRARADYFMIERNHEEDDTSFRGRLDEASEKLRARTSAFGDKAKAKSDDATARLSTAADSAKEQARAAAEKAKQLYRDNSMVGGLAAIAAGAIAGSALPTSRIEQEKLGDIADTARTKVTEQKDKLVDQAERSLDGEAKPEPRAT